MALYVDGFNLYHAINALNEPHLKWLNLWSLGERLLQPAKEKVVKVRYFTAIKSGSEEKKQRHREYLTALACFGVETTLGHFISDSVDCRKCNHVWFAPKEKETDVNLAVRLIDDAYQDVFDKALLLTADSDQAATAKLFKERFPNKVLVSVVPPGMEPSKAILTHTSLRQKITVEYLEDSLLPKILVEDHMGKPTLRFKSPAKYHPPDGWLPPKQRARSK